MTWTVSPSYWSSRGLDLAFESTTCFADAHDRSDRLGRQNGRQEEAMEVAAATPSMPSKKTDKTPNRDSLEKHKYPYNTRHVRLELDNTTAVLYINKEGRKRALN